MATTGNTAGGNATNPPDEGENFYSKVELLDKDRNLIGYAPDAKPGSPEDFGEDPTLTKQGGILDSARAAVKSGVDKVTGVIADQKRKLEASRARNRTIQEGIKLAEAELSKPENAKLSEDEKREFVNKVLKENDRLKFNTDIRGAVNAEIKKRAETAANDAANKRKKAAVIRAEAILANDREVQSKTDPAERKNTLLQKLKGEGFDEADAERAVNMVLKSEEKREKRQTEQKTVKAKGKSALNAEKVILASTLAVHAGTSIAGKVADATWSGIKGAGRLVVEEAIGLGENTLNLGIQAGKTVIYPLGRIGFGAKNRLTRGFDWAVKTPNPPSAGTNRIWNLAKRAWYRTKQGALIAVATPIGLVAGTVEGAALAIPRDILGIHTEGEASVSETGSRKIAKLNKLKEVDGGVLGIGYSAYKFIKDIVWDAPIRAFTEQLTAIKETPQAEASTSGSSGGSPASESKAPEPAGAGGAEGGTEAKEVDEKDESNKKHSVMPVHSDESPGFVHAAGKVAKYFRKKKPKGKDFDETLDAVAVAFGKKDSVITNTAKGIRKLFSNEHESDHVEIKKEFSKQLFTLEAEEDIEHFTHALALETNLMEFRKNFRLLFESSRMEDALKTSEGIAEVKRQIANFFDVSGPIDASEVEEFVDAMKEKMEEGGHVDGKIIGLLNRVPGCLSDARLKKLYLGDKAGEIKLDDYTKFSETLLDSDKETTEKLVKSFNARKFASHFGMIRSSESLKKIIELEPEKIRVLLSQLLSYQAPINSLTEFDELLGHIIAKIDETSASIDEKQRMKSAYGELRKAFKDFKDQRTEKDAFQILFPEPKEKVKDIKYEEFGKQVKGLRSHQDKEVFLESYDPQSFADIYGVLADSRYLKTLDDGTQRLKEIRDLLGSLLGGNPSLTSAESLVEMLGRFADRLNTAPEKSYSYKAQSNLDLLKGDIQKIKDTFHAEQGTQIFKMLFGSNIYFSSVQIGYDDFTNSLMNIHEHKQSILSFVNSINWSKFYNDFNALGNAEAFASLVGSPKGKEAVMDKITAFFSFGKNKPDAATIKQKADLMLEHLGSDNIAKYGLDDADEIKKKLIRLIEFITATKSVLTQAALHDLVS